MSTTPDVLVDRYEVGPLVGAGGMAEVYEGRDRLLARRVAIKVLLQQYSRDPNFLTRFKREAQSAASLTHPNIVSVYDTGVQAGTNFIVMEYIEGRTLRDVIRQEGPLLPVRAAEVAAEVCSALGAAHSRGIIHRDIKPANIMITTDGLVKVMDFGIARAASAESITQTSAVVGTAQYISPEQAQATGVDARTDLYSLGVCLYEMLSGRVPFTGNTPVAIAYQHVRDNPPPLRQLNPDVPPDLESVVMKAMAKNPANRYQSAAELRQDLDRLRSGQRVLATPLLADQATQAVDHAAYHQGDQGTAMLGGPMTQGGPSPATGQYGNYAGAYDPYASRVDRRAKGGGQKAAGRILLFLAIALLAGLAAYAISKATQRTPPQSTLATPIAVPDVVGKDVGAAKQQLEDRGFTTRTRQQENDKEAGTVIETDPAPGRKVSRGSQVLLVVSSGPSSVKAPRLVGLTIPQAQRIAGQSGFQVKRDNSKFSDSVPKDRIISQDPDVGEEVGPDAEKVIRVTVSNGPSEPVETTTPPTTTPPTTTPPTTEPPTTIEPPTTTEDDGGGGLLGIG